MLWISIESGVRIPITDFFTGAESGHKFAQGVEIGFQHFGQIWLGRRSLVPATAAAHWDRQGAGDNDVRHLGFRRAPHTRHNNVVDRPSIGKATKGIAFIVSRR